MKDAFSLTAEKRLLWYEAPDEEMSMRESVGELRRINVMDGRASQCSAEGKAKRRVGHTNRTVEGGK